MNIASAEMLQNSLQNLTKTFQQSRQQQIEAAYRQQQLELEQQRNETDKALRQAQMQYAVDRGKAEDRRAAASERHADSSDRRADIDEARLDAMEKRFGVQEGFKAAQEAKDNIVKGLQGLALDKTMSPDDKTTYLQQSIDSLTDDAKAGILQNPQIKSLYEGNGDWSSVADAVSAHQAKAAPEDERETTVEHPEVLPTPEVPPVHHWFKPDEPGKPAVPGSPAWKETVKQRVPPGQPMPTNAPFAMPPTAAPTTPPTPGAPVTGLTPGMGDTALNVNGVPTGKPDPRDIQWLTQSPTPQRVAKFESVYGKGSASALLQPPAAPVQ